MYDSAAGKTVPQNFDAVIAYYEGRLAEQTAIVEHCVARWNKVGYLRGGMFLLSLVPLGLGLATVLGVRTPWFWLAGFLFLMFLVVAWFHEGLQANIRRSNMMANYYRESLARCRRQWKQIKVPAIEVPKDFLAVSTDLNLLDEASVFRLLGITRTPQGIEILRRWIMEGAAPDQIRLRQEAIAELSREVQWREQFWLRCEQLSTGLAGPKQFVEWAEAGPWFEHRRWLLWLARATAIGSLVSLGAWLIGLMTISVAFLVLLVSCAINFLLTVIYAGSIHDIFNSISNRSDEANLYVSLFDRVTNFPAKTTKLQSLQVRLLDRQHGASRSLHVLGRWTALANIRRNAVLGIPYIFLEFLFFWDVHVLDQMERWKKENGNSARGWFDDLGQWEALCALAKLAADEPEWKFPEVVEKSGTDSVVVTGKQVAHPLLDHGRVPNDVQLGPPGTLLLVTGSNMSGKSTLLRSIGANIVLAQMGSVVCAEQFKLSPVHIETSMRIADSLADGVSFFMAELKRLKEIVDRGVEYQTDTDRTMLFLLDEILQGTNSRERQIAVSRVVRKLIDRKAIGAISTHDLDLATTDELRQACQTVHFSEQFSDVDGKKEMKFDYRMQQGLAETTNALKLLEMVGLGED